MSKRPRRNHSPDFKAKVALAALLRSRALKIALGIVPVLAGLVGFLPNVGFWMIPLDRKR
jgi:hypothetical protein